MNMGDFRGSDVPGEGMFNTNNTFQFLDGMSSSDRDQIKDLLEMEEVQSGLKTLAENLPGFQSFVDAMNGNTAADTTEAPTTTSGMGLKLSSRYLNPCVPTSRNTLRSHCNQIRFNSGFQSE